MESNNQQEELTSKVKLTFKDAIEGLKIFALNPVGGIPSFYQGLGKQRALGVGIAFGITYTCCIIFGASNVLDEFFYGEDSLPSLVVLSVANFLSIVGASYITRKLFRGYGCIESDFFIAGIALTPLSLLILSTKLLGLGNIEILLVVLIISVTYTILMLYTGINKVSNISETASALSVSFMILLVLWLSKIIMTTVFD